MIEDRSPRSQRISTRAVVANLPSLLDFVHQACEGVGVAASVTSSLKLAVEEVCMNIITHGYAGSEPGPIELSFRAQRDSITVVVADRAKPFTPEAVPSPDLGTTWRSRRSGGLGWHLVKQMVDHVRHERIVSGGNSLTLVKYIKPLDSA